MTREEAVALLERYSNYDGMGIPNLAGCKEAMKVAAEALKEAYPQLAESEDERIRKAILGLTYIDGIEPILTKCSITAGDIRSYLEKQKENIEKEYVFRPLAGTDITVAAEQAIRRANEGDRLVLAFNGAYIPVRKGCNANKIVDIYEAFIEKQKEQKPYEPKNWPADKDNLTQEQKPADLSEMMVHKEPYIAPVPTPMVADEQKHILKFKVGDKVHLEGDDVNILTITGIEKDRYLTDCAYGPILFGAEDIWEIVEQKPEWSEEDELMMKAVIGILGEDDHPKLCSWLKSLRPSWKPSEDELAKRHLEGYIMGREDALRKMKDFIESHFSTQSGTSTLKAEG